MHNFLRRCITSLVGKADRDMRVQQVSYNGKAEDAEIYAPYGMSYNLPPDCLCLYAQIGGDQGNLVVLPDRSQDRVKDLKEGEVAFFNPLTKTRTIYRQNGDMEIVTEGENGDVNLTVKGVANINAPTTNWVGDINHTGDLTSIGTVTAQTVAAVTSMTVAGKEQKDHNHTPGTYKDSGGGNVTGNSGAQP